MDESFEGLVALFRAMSFNRSRSTFGGWSASWRLRHLTGTLYLGIEAMMSMI